MRRTEFRALGGSRVYKGAIWGQQIGNPGYNPSRRNRAPSSPGFLQASACVRMRSRYSAGKRRRWAFAGTSGSGSVARDVTEGPKAAVALRAPSASAPSATSISTAAGMRVIHRTLPAPTLISPGRLSHGLLAQGVVSEPDGGHNRDRTLAAALQRRAPPHESRRPHPRRVQGAARNDPQVVRREPNGRHSPVSSNQWSEETGQVSASGGDSKRPPRYDAVRKQSNRSISPPHPSPRATDAAISVGRKRTTVSQCSSVHIKLVQLGPSSATRQAVSLLSSPSVRRVVVGNSWISSRTRLATCRCLF